MIAVYKFFSVLCLAAVIAGLILFKLYKRNLKKIIQYRAENEQLKKYKAELIEVNARLRNTIADRADELKKNSEDLAKLYKKAKDVKNEKKPDNINQLCNLFKGMERE